MDKNKRSVVSIAEKAETKLTRKTKISNGIVEEDGKAYILCGDTKVPLVGGYIKLN